MPHPPVCQPGLVLRATAESPQRQKCARGSAAWSGDWPCRLPSYSLSRHVERSANVATEALIQDPWGRGWAEIPPLQPTHQRRPAACFMPDGHRQRQKTQPVFACELCIRHPHQTLTNSRTSPVRANVCYFMNSSKSVDSPPHFPVIRAGLVTAKTSL